MHIHVLHHGRCFDGAASAALFAAWMRARHGSETQVVYRPKHHCQGDPFDDLDFRDADASAVVDFRYTQRDELTWFFDHHRSAFQLPGDRAHFDADEGGQKFHDEAAPSCAGYLAEIAKTQFGVDLGAHAELIRWADTIDSADYPGPEVAVAFQEPALRLGAWIQSARDPEAISAFLDELLVTPMAKLVEADWIRLPVEAHVEAHRENIELVREVAHASDGVFVYDLLDHGPRVLSHFIPYYLDPSTRYSVGMYAHPDGDLRLSVGFNPWSTGARAHDLAALCEQHGGGGHPYVAGASFGLEARERLRRAGTEISGTLRSPGPST